jgi:hypothetical protein
MGEEADVHIYTSDIDDEGETVCGTETTWESSPISKSFYSENRSLQRKSALVSLLSATNPAWTP